MPTKTDRILSYLPGTFRALPRPTALYSVVDAFGNELLFAENSLAEIMRADWVDHADRGAEFIDDLARFAALYGLAPRPEEDVEGFREHLKRYVRTFIEGTVTVQGVLRVVAEALGLRIADAYADMDSWWTRRDDVLVTVAPRGDDAARLLFGTDAAVDSGRPARAASVEGLIDLSVGVDLRDASILRVRIEAGAPLNVDLASHAANPAAATLDEIVTALNTALGLPVASHDGRRLALASPAVGPASRLEIHDVDGDAAQRLLDLRPRLYRGAQATGARVTGTVDLSGGADLSDARYLRLLVDGVHLAEVDCAGAVPAATTLAEIVAAVNSALGLAVASHDGRFLTLASPTTGFTSSIAFQAAAAQDARERLFGPRPPFHGGRDALPAEATGTRDLTQGVDLSARSRVRVRLNDGPPVTVECAGADPARTRLAELVAALNAALGPGIAGHDGRFVSLTSAAVGHDAAIAFEPLPPEEDAIQAIFGVGPRVFQGAAATRARVAGTPDLSAGVNLWARHVIGLAIDGGTPVEIDLRRSAAHAEAATLEEIAAAIDAVFGASVAGHDGRHLILSSPTSGGASRVAVEPLETSHRRRFVTRAFITDEAAQTVLGFIRGEARGGGVSQARVAGTVDLSRGVDLRARRFLRISLDGAPARDIDCAAPARVPRPRAAMLDEIVLAIDDVLGPGAASHDGRRLVLTSSSTGAASRIAFGPPRAADALEVLLGLEPGTVRGRDATRVQFVGMADLSGGADLSAADRVKIGIDGSPPVEIACAGADPSRTTLNEIVMAINVALGVVVAHHDGAHIVLASPLRGHLSQIEFAPPAGPDATSHIFGIIPPRRYHGADAARARAVGARNLSAGADLRLARFLRLRTDGRAQVDVDCAALAADPARATLDEITATVNAALGPGHAAHDGAHLILESPTAGASSRIDLLPYTAGDARAALFGAIPEVTTGSDPTPAVLTGRADLLTPVNLAERRVLRLAVDGGRPVDVDVAGAAPATTFLDEIVTRINAAFPGLASATDDDRLRLTSPTAGEGSRLEVLPIRALELVEYPSEQTEDAPRTVRHGDHWFVRNTGVADASLEIEVSAPRGVAGPALVSLSTRWRIRVTGVVRPGERIRVWRDPEDRLRAAIVAADGTLHPVPGTQLLAGPLGAQAWVPFTGEWRLAGGDPESPATLQLNNPLEPAVIILRARRRGAKGSRITVRVVEAALAAAGPVSADGRPVRLVGRVRVDATGHRLVDAGEMTLARLRPGPGVAAEEHVGRVVAALGPLHPGDGAPPLMVVEHLADLFDVTLGYRPTEGSPVAEFYPGVTIGTGASDPDDLTWQMNTRSSQLVLATDLEKATALVLPRGQSEWMFLDCYSARFDRDRFDVARFANRLCRERAVFNVSRFARTPPETEAAVFAASGPLTDPPVEVRFRWTRYRPGAFVVNLPADLPEEFGGRFNEARFGRSGDAPERYDGVVTEPTDDPDHLVARVNAASALVQAAVVARVPLGWEPAPMPFRRPRMRTLTGGADGEPARLYLAEKDVPGFIELRARQPGAWGNAIAVSARKAGPARFDVTIGYRGARFENARQVALGPPLAALTQQMLNPGPIGVLQAKAAGVLADVTRDRAG